MQPRLPSSLKWTPVPSDFDAKVISVFTDQFPSEADAGEFVAEGRLYAEEILLRVGYLEKGRLRQLNFETSISYSQEKKNATERLYRCVDAAASMMEEYFVSLERSAGAGAVEDGLPEALDLPSQWRPYEFEGETIYMQTSTVNSRLENEADRLLGLADESLVQDPGETEDALARAVIDNDLAFELQRQIRQGPTLN